ncbi:MAG: type III secretion system export apparatus subunit SctS [Hyphomonas sp.]
MNNNILELTQQALYLILMLSAPPIIVASLIGLLVALLQAATQVQEQTLQYTLKFFGIVVTLFITAAFVGGALYAYANGIFSSFWTLV